MNLFKMSDDVWAVHANPWSVWTRYPCLPLLFLGIWSRVWIGWWCLLPVVGVCGWIWFNPRAFGKPKTMNHWASQAVLGERVMLSPPPTGIPAHHKRAICGLKVLMFAGCIPAIIGLIIFNPLLTISGLVIVMLGKTWFLDRMVWLYQDLKDSNPEYTRWTY